jgi:hypothetical protein
MVWQYDNNVLTRFAFGESEIEKTDDLICSLLIKAILKSISQSLNC